MKRDDGRKSGLRKERIMRARRAGGGVHNLMRDKHAKEAEWSAADW